MTLLARTRRGLHLGTLPKCKVMTRRMLSRAESNSSKAKARATSTKSKNFIYCGALLVTSGLAYLYTTDTRSSIHRYVAVPSLRFVFQDAEKAHEAGISILRVLYNFGINPKERGSPVVEGDLSVEIFGHVIDNPIGISAGLDKHAEIPTPLFELGPGIVEVGGITPVAQDGNVKPRVFRIASQNALINRYGLNSNGAEHAAAQLRHRLHTFARSRGLGSDEATEEHILAGRAGVPPGSLIRGRLLAVQIAKNKNTPDGDIDAVTRDYVYCTERLAKYADMIVVNVSSPNTPGLRTLQRAEPLREILVGVVSAAKRARPSNPPRVMVKVSPDEDTQEQVTGICQAVWMSGVDGVVVGNTTKKRPDPIPKGYALTENEANTMLEQGGYSGPQLFERTLSLVQKYRKTLDEALNANPGHDLHQKVIFATGGITSGEEALKVLNAGASVAQIYTAMVYGGVGTVSRIKDEMRSKIKGDLA